VLKAVIQLQSCFKQVIITDHFQPWKKSITGLYALFARIILHVRF